jgi:MFS family permease
MTTVAPQRLSADFWKFWTGQTISNLGTSVTAFALPLLVYKLTGSALNLGLTLALGMLPNLFFGLFIGAWVDRVDRKRLMIAVDILQLLFIASVPLVALFGPIPIWWVYVVVFFTGLLTVFFQAAEFAAIPSLVPNSDLVTANGRIQASYSAAMVAGPLLAGLLVAVIPVEDLLLIDAVTFGLSAVLLGLIRRGFNTAGSPRSTSIMADIGEGLRYVWDHPVLRNISLMMCLVNLVGTTVYAQLVLFVSERYGASESQVGLFFSAGSAGVVVMSLAAGVLRSRFGFSKVALGALMLSGLLTTALALTPWYWLGVTLWALQMGLGIMFNINTGSLRQAIVPGHMLGRVISVAMVIAWSANPIGALVGGWLIERTGSVSLVYAGIGVLTFLIPLAFAFTALGRAEQYLPAAAATDGQLSVKLTQEDHAVAGAYRS